jgi:hypothetical protein
LKPRVPLPAQHLRANLPSYEVGLYEQNVLTYLFYTKHEMFHNAVFDASSYGLNTWCAFGGSSRACATPWALMAAHVLTMHAVTLGSTWPCCCLCVS